MYEYVRKARRTRGMYGLGTDEATPGMQLALDYRSGAKTRAEVQQICLQVSPASRYRTDYSECRWFITPEDQCRREQGHACTEEELRQQCFFTPDDLRNDRCFFHMENMTRAEVEASNAGPIVESSPLQQAAGAVAEYRNRVADAAENIVRTLRPVDSNVQAVQNAVLAAGCILPRYGADGRWGTETESGVRCLAERQSWNTVISQYPWIAQRIQVPTQQVAETDGKPAGAVASITQVLPAVSTPTTSVSAASIFPSLGLPTWAPWAILGVGFFSIFTFGLYLARKRG
jgi:hypothetical protein